MSEQVEVTVGGQVYAQSLGNRVDALDVPEYRPQSPECPVQWWAEEARRFDQKLKAELQPEWPYPILENHTPPFAHAPRVPDRIMWMQRSMDALAALVPAQPKIVMVPDRCQECNMPTDATPAHYHWCRFGSGVPPKLLQCSSCAVPLDGVTMHKGDCRPGSQVANTWRLLPGCECPICREVRGIVPETRKVSWWGWVKWWFGR